MLTWRRCASRHWPPIRTAGFRPPHCFSWVASRGIPHPPPIPPARSPPRSSIEGQRPPAMELLIVRHAIAFERSATRWAADDERPLSPQGVERARQAAAGLKRGAERPARVLTSPL